MPVPSSWAMDMDLSSAHCEDIDGAFLNLGQRIHENGLMTEDGLLAEHVFARRLSRRDIAQSVDIQSSADAGWAQATLVGKSTLKVGFAVSCQAGWHVLVETRSGQYLGEGVEQEKFRQLSYFRLDRRRRLVARVQTNATYRRDSGEVTQEGSENWYRFEATSMRAD